MPSVRSSADTRLDAQLPVRVGVFQPSVPRYRRPVWRALARRCVQLDVFCGALPSGAGFESDTRKGTYYETRVTHWTCGPVWWMPAMWAVAGGGPHDVLVYSWNVRYAQLLPGILRARRAGRGVVVWGHGYSKRERGLKRWVRNRIARAADSIVTYNEAAAQRLIAEGLPADRVFVAPNALDQDEIQAARATWLASADRLAAFRREQGIADRPVALHVSRLVAGRGLETLLEVWREVLRSQPDAQLVVIGDGPARTALEQLAAAAGLGTSVRFLGAVYGEEHLAPWFLSARCMPFLEQIGLSLHHAFGYGCPVVTFNTPHNHGPEFELIVDGENGYAVQAGDKRAAVARLCSLLGDPALATRLGAAARQTVLSRYTIEHMVGGLVEAIACALAAARRRGGARGNT